MQTHISHSERRKPLGVRADTRLRAERGRTAGTETPLSIRSHNLTAAEGLGTYVQERAGFHLGKFAWRIERVSVRFDPMATFPKSPPKVRCRVKVVLNPMQTVFVQASSRTARLAFGEALGAAERATRELLKRHTRLERRRRG